MDKIKENIANNIIELRKINNMTQADLAQNLNFTDKTISKWERGESTPDIESLANIAKLFNLTVDELISDEINKTEIKKEAKQENTKTIAKIALAIITIWFIGTSIFVYGIIDKNADPFLWLAFIWPVPASCLFVTIVAFKLKMHKTLPIASSCSLWTFLASVYLQSLSFNENIWIIFIIGVPLQLIIIITYWINKK